MKKKGRLVLEDGTVYEGYSFGSSASKAGEVVFTTGMVGYPESLTDPSFRGQIMVCTFPLIGNYGVPPHEQEDMLLKHFESEHIHVQGLIVADYSEESYHWNRSKSLADWLQEEKIPALTGIDTRALTKKIREHGVMLGKIIIDNDTINNTSNNSPNNTLSNISNDLSFDDPNVRNLVAEVSTKEKITYTKGPLTVLLIDCGVKHNIIRSFLERDITVIRVPWDYDYSQEEFDGLFISNGPGDPKQCTVTIGHLQQSLQQDYPIFGICLGSQLLALAAGANTYKLKYGHRGQNQPCLDITSRRCFITSQNHGFAVDTKVLPQDWEAWFENANDHTNEGIKHKSKPYFSVQFHPEAHPGPGDTQFLFDLFLDVVKKQKKSISNDQQSNKNQQFHEKMNDDKIKSPEEQIVFPQGVIVWG